MNDMNVSSHVRPGRGKGQSRSRPKETSGAGATLRGAARVDRCDVDVVHLPAVQAARGQMPDADHLASVSELLSLLSNPTRLRILLALRSVTGADDRELCVCDLAIVAEASKSLTSHQLRLLRAAGLVLPRRRGKLVYYRLAEGPATALVSDAVALMGGDDLGARTRPEPGRSRAASPVVAGSRARARR